MNPIVTFIEKTFNVEDIADIKNTFNVSNGVPGYEPAKTVNCTIDLVRNNEGKFVIPPPKNENSYQPKQRYKDMPVDLNCVSIQYLSLKYVKNDSKTDAYHIRHNFVPVHGAEKHEKMTKVAEASGRIPNVCFTAKPGMDAPIRMVIFEPNPMRLDMQDYCIKTFMMLDTSNIMNGVIQIEPSLCSQGQLPKTGVTYDEEGQSVPHDIDFYYLLPYSHVMCWELHCGDLWRKKNGLFAIEMEVLPKGTDEPYTPFFLVCNKTFDKLREGYLKNHFGMVDKRPLSSLEFEILDRYGKPCLNAPLKLTIGITFIAYPNTKPYPPILPSLDPNFVPYEKVLQQKIDLQRYLKEDREYNERVKDIKIKK